MDLSNPVFPAFILFCRVGGCLMTAPGFSSERVPMQFRLYLALAVTLVLAPPLLERFNSVFADATPHRLAVAIFAELLIGASLGLLARFYFLALETLATSVAMTVGLGNIFGAAVTEAESTPTFSSFVLVAALALVFRPICISRSSARSTSPMRRLPFSGSRAPTRCSKRSRAC